MDGGYPGYETRYLVTSTPVRHGNTDSKHTTQLHKIPSLHWRGRLHTAPTGQKKGAFEPVDDR